MVTGRNLELVAYALLATLSPVGFAATLAVIESGRLKALVFGVAFVGAQLGTLAALAALGAVATPERARSDTTVRALLELAFGLALLLLAAALHRRPEGPGGGTHAVLDRLRRLHTGTAFAAGILLGIGGPKRLVLSALAATAITASSGDDKVRLVVIYTAVATLLVWAPILAFEIAGEGVVARLSALNGWLARHQRGATYAVLLGIGTFAVVDAVVKLL